MESVFIQQFRTIVTLMTGFVVQGHILYIYIYMYIMNCRNEKVNIYMHAYIQHQHGVILDEGMVSDLVSGVLLPHQAMLS